MERPPEFANERRDCTVVALTLASGLPYDRVHSAFKECGRKEKHGVHLKKVVHKVCKLLNLKATQVKRSGSLRKFATKFPQGNYICHKRHHAFAVMDGKVLGEEVMGSYIKGAWRIEQGEMSKEEMDREEEMNKEGGGLMKFSSSFYSLYL